MFIKASFVELNKTKHKKAVKTMKGGASASASHQSRKSAASAVQPGVQPTEIDYPPYHPRTPTPSVLRNGIHINDFYSSSPYNCITSYSDHAPIVYEINPFVKIITWNVGNFGNEEYGNGQNITYNHKFNLQRREKVDEYILRLMNIVSAMSVLINNNKTQKGNPSNPSNPSNPPFLFCQELPQMNHGGSKADKSHQPMLIEIFIKLLEKHKLKLIGFRDYECGLICDIDAPDILTYHDDLTQNSPDQRYSYFSTSDQNTYYVNMHVAYKSNLEQDIIACIIEIKRKSPHVARIFFLGDLNRSLLHQNFDNLKRQNNFVIYTTPGNDGYSLADNKGNKNEHNVDGVLQVLFL